MLSHMKNRKFLCYVSLFAAIGAVLCFRANSWMAAGACLVIGGSSLAAAWLSAQSTHTHLHLR